MKSAQPIFSVGAAIVIALAFELDHQFRNSALSNAQVLLVTMFNALGNLVLVLSCPSNGHQGLCSIPCHGSTCVGSDVCRRPERACVVARVSGSDCTWNIHCRCEMLPKHAYTTADGLRPQL